jgi:hypothetical protein
VRWKEARGASQSGRSGWRREEMTEGEATALYETALGEAAGIAAESVSKGFEASRRRTVEEFEEFLEILGWGVGFETATDLDVIAFIQGWKLPAHLKNCQTVNEKGEKVVSVSSMKGVIRHLSKTYSMRGRRDEDNPGESVKSYCEGYWNRLHSAGVQEKRAKICWRRESGRSDFTSREANREKQWVSSVCVAVNGFNCCALPVGVLKSGEGVR